MSAGNATRDRVHGEDRGNDRCAFTHSFDSGDAFQIDSEISGISRHFIDDLSQPLSDFSPYDAKGNEIDKNGVVRSDGNGASLMGASTDRF